MSTEPNAFEIVDKDKKEESVEVNLTQAYRGLKKLLLGAGWDFNPYEGEPLDIDFSCFVLGRDGMTREDEDFVFYNNPNGAQLAVKHLGDNRTGQGDGDDEAIMVDINNLSFEIWRIILVVSIYQGNERDQGFRDMRELVVRAEDADSGTEIYRSVIPGGTHGGATAIKVGELYRNGIEWIFNPINEPVNGGLAEIARSYGILISSTT